MNDKQRETAYRCSATWRKNNPDAMKAIWARARAKRKGVDSARNAEKYAANRAENRAKALVYYRANREECLARSRRWQIENPDKVRANSLNRRALLAAAGQPRNGRLKADDIGRIISRQKGRCAACGAKCKLTMDHVMPLALGGDGSARNFQGLCQPCNSSKRDKHPVEFNRSLGLLL